jgi:hypothetical protein
VEPVLLAIGQRRFLVALEQLRKPQDCVQRRSQFVTHRRQELVLRRVGLLCRSPRALQLALALDLVGDVGEQRNPAALGRASLDQADVATAAGPQVQRPDRLVVIPPQATRELVGIQFVQIVHAGGEIRFQQLAPGTALDARVRLIKPQHPGQAVAQDQAIVGVPDEEAALDAVERTEQVLLQPATIVFQTTLLATLRMEAAANVRPATVTGLRLISTGNSVPSLWLATSSSPEPIARGSGATKNPLRCCECC